MIYQKLQKFLKSTLVVFITLQGCLALTINAANYNIQKDDKIIFLGDSITQQGARPGGYVDIISQTIAKELPEKGIQVIGAGVSGNKTPNLLARLERDVLSQNPQVVVIYIGINDIWHWTKPHPVTKESRKGTTKTDYDADLRNIIKQIQAKGARVILCTPTVIGENLEAANINNKILDQYSNIVRSIAIDTKSGLIDLRQVFSDYLTTHNTQQEKKGILTKDSVHMNQAGNQLIAQTILSALGIKQPTIKPAVQLGATDVYLCIGQSNMAGRGAIPKDQQEPIPNAYLLDNNNQWTPATHPMNQYSTVRKDIAMQKFSPSYSFAQKMASTSQRPVGFIVNAKGGSKVENWVKGGEFYTDILTRVQAAQAQGGTLRGVIWHQGESNHQDTQYLSKLIQFISDLRADLSNETLPFIVGQINNVPLINDQLASLPEQLAYTACVSSKDLVAQDKWHFNTESLTILGQGYAQAMLKLHNQ